MIVEEPLSISRRDLEERIRAFREKGYEKSVTAVFSAAEWDGDNLLETPHGERYRVFNCPTPLSMRWALSQVGDTSWNFLITPLSDAALSLDIRARLSPYHRVYQPNPAESLRTAFAASRQHDDLVSDRKDVGRILTFLKATAADVDPAPLGVLSADHLYGQLIQRAVFRREVRSLRDLLVWSQTSRATADWDFFLTSLSEDIRDRALSWLKRTLGDKTHAVVSTLINQGPEKLVTYGFLAEVLSVPALSMTEEQSSALSGFRVLTQSGGSTREQLGVWAGASISMLEHEQTWDAAHAAEELLLSPQGLGHPGLAPLSTVFRTALDARLSVFAHAASEALRSGELGATQQALESVREHHREVLHGRNLPVVESLTRLLAWLHHQRAYTTDTLADWLAHYRSELSWVDTCINRAWDGTTSPDVSVTATAIISAVRERRKEADRNFARQLAQTGTQRFAAGSTRFIEDVLDSVVFPIHDGDSSEMRPVLLLVLDGASVGVLNDVLASIMSTYPGDWREMMSPDSSHHTALAALPTVTTVSRASLLSGELTTGGQHVEREKLRTRYHARFKNKDADACRLLHKDDLNTGINDSVKDLLEDTHRTPFLAAVLNTVDDALGGSHPMGRVWGLKDIAHLAPLLEGAAKVGRTVILTSDHGHIVEKDHAGIVATDEAVSSRWRSDMPAADNNEIAVAGDRVLVNGGSAVLAVDEDVRYTAKKAGYHGGASLAEACVPVAVLSAGAFGPGSAFPAEPVTRRDLQPKWWSLHALAVETTAPAPVAHPVKQQAPTLFDAPTTPARDRYTDLARSEMFITRLKAYPVAGRGADDVIDLLRRIDANTNRLPRAILRDSWALSPTLLRGVIAGLRRILNIDGVEALTTEGDDLVLHPELLFEQFGVGGRD